MQLAAEQPILVRQNLDPPLPSHTTLHTSIYTHRRNTHKQHTVHMQQHHIYISHIKTAGVEVMHMAETLAQKKNRKKKKKKEL